MPGSIDLWQGHRDLMVRGTGYVRPSQYEVALLKKLPDNTYQELTLAGYARQIIPLTSSAWHDSSPHTTQYDAPLRFPPTGTFPGGTRIDAVALWANRGGGPDIYDLCGIIPGGFTLPASGGYIMIPARKLTISFNHADLITLATLPS